MSVVTAPQQDLKLVVNADSWHFRYFTFIRKQWGMSPPLPRTSLCPYCQTMFWGSVFIMLFGVLIILGWLEIKVARFFYKLLGKCGFDRLLVWLSPTADVVDDCSQKMEKSFAFASVVVSLFTLIGLALLGLVIFLVVTAGWGIFLLIPQLPELVWEGLLEVGWALFWVCGIIGLLLHSTGGFLVWLFTNGSLWLTIASWAGVVIGSAVLLAIMGYGIYLLFTRKMMKRFGGWALSRVNGFKAARDLASKAKTKIEITRRMKSKPVSLSNRLLKWLSSFFSKEINTSGAKVSMLGPLGIIWVYIKAIKKNMCPMISFVDSEGKLIGDWRAERIVELENIINSCENKWSHERAEYTEQEANLVDRCRVELNKLV